MRFRLIRSILPPPSAHKRGYPIIWPPARELIWKVQNLIPQTSHGAKIGARAEHENTRGRQEGLSLNGGKKTIETGLKKHIETGM